MVSRASAFLHVLHQRSRNRLYDLLAILHGYCNHRPWSPIPGQGGGYAHWRCALKGRHLGLHRENNYVWGPDGKTEYMPVNDCPAQPWRRSMIPTLSQSRITRAWHDEQRRKRGYR